jgi:two-component system chemotaxis response regulator CheY
MARAILLVDDQRDILRLLHSALDTLRNPDLEIFEADSGEAALEEVSRRRVDLLVTDYNLPGISGTELMHKLRAGQPDIRVILITDSTDRKVRDEMLNAGAAAIFSKPVPLGDFLDAVERGLGVIRTILPAETEQKPQTGQLRVSDLLANFRQDIGADAVLLINNRGLVVARAGDLRDSSMEVSLTSALTAAYAAGLKVADSNHQGTLSQFSVFTGGDHDLFLMPVDASYLLLLAGENLAGKERLLDTLQSMTAVKNEVAKGLRTIGAAAPARKKRTKTDELAKAAPEMEALLKGASDKGINQEELDAFWDQAATQHANKPTRDDVIPYEEARKMGLIPDQQ